MKVYSKKITKIVYLLILVLASFAIFVYLPGYSAKAAVPKFLNFQGKLTKNADGTNVPNGNYSMQFKIYDSLSNGNLLWTETWDGTSGTTQVAVVNGVFSVKLGSFNSLSGLDFSTGSLYLSVNFNPGTGYDGEMSPRKQLISSPFALNANSVVGDGRLDLTSTATSSPIGKFNYNPITATTGPAVIISAGANVQGPALNVVQAGSGYAALFTGGNVGIGTTTPGQALSVVGGMRLTGALFDSNNASGTPGMILQTTGLGTQWVATSTLGIVGGASASGTPGAVQFAGVGGTLNANNLFFWDNVNQRLGIGTATPNSLLQVAGDIRLGVASTTAGQIVFQNSSNGFTTTIKASSTQTSNLTFVLPNSGGSAGQSLMTDGSGGLYFGAASASLSGGLAGYVTRWLSGSMVGTGVMIDNGTVAGINATSSTYTFNIKANPGTAALNIASSSGVSSLVVSSLGNVGINTTTPSASMTVVNTTTQDALLVNQAGTGNIFRLQQSGTDKLIVNQQGTLTLNATDSSIVRASNSDFALGTIGSSLLNVNGALEISDTVSGGIPNSGKGTITSTGQPAITTAVAGTGVNSGALSITRPDGKYYVILGAGATTASCATAGTATNIYDSINGTFTAGTRCMNAAIGAGALALPRPTGQYRVIHGGGLTTSSLVDPTETLAVGASLAFNASASGTVAFLRPDGRYLVTNGGAATAQVYDPVADTVAATAVTGSYTFGQSAVVLPRLDGLALIVTGGATSTTQLYNPNAGAVSGIGPVGSFSVGPSLDGSQAAGTCALNGLGSVAFRRQDGNFVILSKANVWAVYYPASNTISCNASGGPATAMGNGAHAIPLQNNKILILAGGGSTAAYIYDPSNDSFTAHGTTLSPINSGAHSIFRTDGTWQIITGGNTTVTNNYNTGLPMSDTNTVYTSEDIYNTSLNSNSTFRWDAQLEAAYAAIRNANNNTAYSSLQFFVRTAVGSASDCTTPLNNATDYEIRNSGDLIHTVPGGNCVRVRVQFNRPMPKPLIDERGTWVGTGGTTHRLDYPTPTLFSWAIDNSVVLRKTSFDFTNPNSAVNAPDVGPSALTAGTPTSGGSCTPGTHSYYVTFITNGIETQLGTKSNVITCVSGTGQTVPLSVIPTGPTYTTARKIYRTVAGDIGTPKLLTTIADNTTTVFSDTVADGSLGADFTIGESSGPTLTRGEGTRVETTNGQLYLPFGRITPTTMNGTTGFYQGVMSAAHPLLATTTTDGTFVAALDNKTFMVFLAGTTTPFLYDPATQSFTAQSGAGNILTLNNGTTPRAGAFALKRQDGKFLLYLGVGSRTATCNTAGTATNIFNPNAPSGGMFVDGPCLTAAGGMGAFPILNADGTYTIVHGGGVGTTTIYNPVTNRTFQGPLTGASVTNCGAWAIPMGMPFNNQYKVFIGAAPGAASVTTTLNYNAITKVFTAGTALTTASGCGSMAFQRSDGYWVILMGNNVTTTNILNPYNGVTIAGPAMSGNVGRGSNVIPRADGTFLIIHGNNLTTTTVYFPWGGTFGQGVGIGSAAAGPALVNASGPGGLSFQRPDGKFVIISGASTASTTPSNIVNLYDAGWYADGQYLSEQMNVPPLAAGSTLEWKQTPDNYLHFEVKFANSQQALATASWNTINASGQSIGNSGGETWIQVEVNFRRDFPTFCNNLNGAYASGGGQAYCYRQIALPTVNQYQITNGMNLINLQNNGLSVFRVTSNGGIYASSNGGFYSGGADLAENYTSTQKLDKGEVVIGDPNNPKGVLRSTLAYQSTILGVVSTAPGFVAGSYTADSYPIALIGRVPVKVSTENGIIKSGDYLTSASLTGYAMKAIRAGRVLGVALEDLDTSKLSICPQSDFAFAGQRQCGTVTVFVNLINYNGQSVELAMVQAEAASNTADTESPATGLTANNVSNTPALSVTNGIIQIPGELDKSQKILDFLNQLKAQQESMAINQLSEVFTDRLSAVMEVVTPKITANTLKVGEIQADKIKANRIEGLEILTRQLSVLNQQISDLGILVSSSTLADPSLLANLSSTISVPTTTPPVVPLKQGLVFSPDIKILGGLKVDSLGSIQDVFTLTSDTVFLGRPYFTTDTAGFAVIVKNTKSVDVVFDRPYLEQPIVNVTISFNTSTPDAVVRSNEAVQALFDQDVRFVVMNKSVNGFSIVLNKPAPEDVEFSWSALAVRSAKVFSSKLSNVSVVQSPTQISDIISIQKNGSSVTIVPNVQSISSAADMILSSTTQTDLVLPVASSASVTEEASNTSATLSNPTDTPITQATETQATMQTTVPESAGTMVESTTTSGE